MNNQARNIEFADGPFKQLFLDFIRYQHSLGYKYGNSSIYALRSINRDLNQMNLLQEQPCLSKKIAESLAEKRPNEAYGTQHYYYSARLRVKVPNLRPIFSHGNANLA